MKMDVFWDVAPRSLVDTDRRFRGAYRLPHPRRQLSFCIKFGRKPEGKKHLGNIGIDGRTTLKCEIPSSHVGEYEDDCLVGCCAVSRPIALMMEAVSISET
jgi:hypothetical protein